MKIGGQWSTNQKGKLLPIKPPKKEQNSPFLGGVFFHTTQTERNTMEAAHLKMARTGGAQGLGFDFEMPESAPALSPSRSPLVPTPKREELYIDGDDVKYETIKEEAKDSVGVIRAATMERLVW